MMKHLLLLCLGISPALAGIAQSQRAFPVKRALDALQHDPSGAIPYRASRAIIWSDDFSTAANWTAATAPGTDPDNWVLGTNGPAGPFAIPDISSTSAGNGFALYDSDLHCGGNQNAYLVNATPIDLSGYPGAVLEFEQFFRAYYGECFVDVSVNGSDWTEFQVNAEVDINTNTTNPNLVSLDLSPVVANQATVWIRFRYYSSTSAHGQNAGCDYAWMVDDVALVELEAYDLVLNYGVISHTGTGEEYGRVPVAQLNPDMNFGAQVKNFGSLPQTGLSLNLLVTDDQGATILDQDFALGDLAPGALADLDELVPMSGLGAGIYDVSFTVTSNESGSDATPANNAALRQFGVDDDQYALDGIDVYDANQLSAMGTTTFAGSEDGLELLTYYEIAVPTTVYGVSAELANGTEVNSAVIVSIHDTAQVFNNNVNSPIAQSDVVSITAAHLASGRVTGLFSPAVALPPGGYYASIRLLSAANQYDIFVLDDATVPQPTSASLIYTPDDQAVYANGNASAVRLQLNPTVGVSEAVALEGVTVFPNPARDHVEVLVEGSSIHGYELRDALGALVASGRFTQRTRIDLDRVAAGTYSLHVSNERGSAVQRIAVH